MIKKRRNAVYTWPAPPMRVYRDTSGRLLCKPIRPPRRVDELARAAVHDLSRRERAEQGRASVTPLCAAHTYVPAASPQPHPSAGSPSRGTTRAARVVRAIAIPASAGSQRAARRCRSRPAAAASSAVPAPSSPRAALLPSPTKPYLGVRAGWYSGGRMVHACFTHGPAV